MNDQERADALELARETLEYHFPQTDRVWILAAALESAQSEVAQLKAELQEARTLAWLYAEEVDAYIQDGVRPKDVDALKAELEKMVPYEDFAALEATSDAAEENLRRLTEAAQPLKDVAALYDFVPDEQSERTFVIATNPVDDEGLRVSVADMRRLAAALSEAPATEGSADNGRD